MRAFWRGDDITRSLLLWQLEPFDGWTISPVNFEGSAGKGALADPGCLNGSVAVDTCGMQSCNVCRAAILQTPVFGSAEHPAFGICGRAPSDVQDAGALGGAPSNCRAARVGCGRIAWDDR